MTTPQTRTVTINGHPCRIWEKGSGKPLFCLTHGFLLLRWNEFHEQLSGSFRMVVCSLPGFPGSKGHDEIDDLLSWFLVAKDLLTAAGFQPGDTLVGSSGPGALAADVAALWPEWVGRLVLIAPFGLYDPSRPPRDVFAVMQKNLPAVLSSEPERLRAQIAPPEGEDAGEWSIVVNRLQEAMIRFLWPLGDTRLRARLPRIKAPTLVIWGEKDEVLPPPYAQHFVQAIGGKVGAVQINGAGHLAEFDKPELVAGEIVRFAA